MLRCRWSSTPGGTSCSSFRGTTRTQKVADSLLERRADRRPAHQQRTTASASFMGVHEQLALSCSVACLPRTDVAALEYGRLARLLRVTTRATLPGICGPKSHGVFARRGLGNAGLVHGIGRGGPEADRGIRRLPRGPLRRVRSSPWAEGFFAQGPDHGAGHVILSLHSA